MVALILMLTGSEEGDPDDPRSGERDRKKKIALWKLRKNY